MVRLSAKPLPSTSDPMPSRYPGTQYATPPLDRAGFPLIYEGWERPSRRYDPHHTCRNTYEYDQSGPLYRDVIHPGVSKRTKTKTNAIHSHLPTHDHESKRAWVLNWRNSVSAESGTDPDEVSEPAMSDQDDEMASDSSDEEDMATHPDESEECSSSQDENKAPIEDDFLIVNITDLQAVTAELEKEGLKWRVFYPPRRSCSSAREAWLAVGPTNSIVESAARRIMSGAMKTARSRRL